MNLPVLALGAASLLLVLSVAQGRPVGASTEGASLPPAGSLSSIRVSQRATATERVPGAPVRDPFASTPRALPTLAEPSSAAQPLLAAVAPATPPIPEFRVLGKQQDEEGWAVFLAEAGRQGQVWVVREGESFNERFVVARLAPPLLVIKRTGGRQSRTFDIGKEEIEE